MSHKKTQWLAMGPVNVYFGFCGSEKAYRKSIKKMAVENPPEFIPCGAGAVLHTLSDGGAPTLLMCLDVESVKKQYNRIQIDALIAHESAHVAQRCVDEMVAHDEKELFAYIVQYSFGCVANLVWGDK